MRENSRRPVVAAVSRSSYHPMILRSFLDAKSTIASRCSCSDDPCLICCTVETLMYDKYEFILRHVRRYRMHLTRANRDDLLLGGRGRRGALRLPCIA